jgi:hypothetical protein
MTTMSKPKPGDLLTYMADIERTGVVLDRGPSPMVATYEGPMGETVWKPADYRVWVHREDGTFDLVRVFLSGKHAGRTSWFGQFTASGQALTSYSLPAQSA